jgi:hypothetical protein
MSFVVTCPHCLDPVVIEAVNCGIFRHAAYRENHTQVDPHAPQTECERLLALGLIYGCGKPFRVEDGVAVSCAYV